MSKDITYGDYLRLPSLLACQQPLTKQHDELLFVILHQTMELWMKQVLHEVSAAQMEIRAANLVPAYKHLARVSRIQAVMTNAWDILSTMTAADYLSFRDALGTSSGFQSAQFRTLEYRLGIRDKAFLRFQAEQSPEWSAMKQALDEPTLYDDVLTQLAQAGFDIAEDAYRRAPGAPYQESTPVEDAWLAIYQDTEKYWALYQLAEKLLDLDDALLAWRHKHVVTVERIIGRKRGTGGTDGVSYLQQTLNRRAFPELWSVRTKL